jgi:transposase
MNSDAPIPTPTLPIEDFNCLPEFARSHISHLEVIIQELRRGFQELQTKFHDLEARLSKDSSNSSKPPSSDGLKRKPKSQRGKSDKKPGGQPGRAGKGLAQVANPNKIVVHAPTSCDGCQSDLSAVDGFCAEKRQVFDIPQPVVEVTEHQAVVKKCPCCGKQNKGAFPEDIRGHVQYGHRIQALAAYFAHQHFIPVERTCQIFEDVFGIAISPGTCSRIDEKLFQKLESFETGLKAYLLMARVLHFDETGMRSEKKLHWVHVASSEMATLYTMHAKRGQEAMDEANILPQFNGIAVHDHWYPYFTYKQAVHALCNAHHLRELTFVHEQEKENWAKQMKDLLIRANKEVKKHSEQGMLPAEMLLELDQMYTEIINTGFSYHLSLPPLPKGKRGRQKQRDGHNLLGRLKESRDCVLRFMYDFSVPFTNNRGEQDIRMIKIKQKVSGCFRKLECGQFFCRIRSYISTARKQGWNIWDALTDAVKGTPRLLGSRQEATPFAIAA